MVYNEYIFGTNYTISREELLAMIHRYAKYKKYDMSKEIDISMYTDSDKVADYAVDAFKWAIANKIIEGTSPTTLSPKKDATRAEFAQILMNFLVNFISSDE